MLGPDYAALEFQIAKFRFYVENGNPLKVLSRRVTQSQMLFEDWSGRHCMEWTSREISEEEEPTRKPSF